MIVTTSAHELDGWDIREQLGMVHGLAIHHPFNAILHVKWPQTTSKDQPPTSWWKRTFQSTMEQVGARHEAIQREQEARYDDTRHLAFQYMLEEARELGADAVIAVHYEVTTINTGSIHYLVYGTAVRARRRLGGAPEAGPLGSIPQ